MLVTCWQKQGFGKGQTTALRCRLDGDVNILAATEPVGKVDEANRVGVTCRVITRSAKLFRHGGMGDDDSGNRGSVIRADKYGRGGSGNSTIGSRDAEETDTQGVMSVISSVEETYRRSFDRAVCKK